MEWDLAPLIDIKSFMTYILKQMIYILFELSTTGWIYYIKIELGNTILYHYFLQKIRAIMTLVKIKFVI